MADNKMKLKIEFDNINKSEKPVQSLVNFFTNNSSLRMLKKDNSDPVEITDSEPFDVIIDDDSFSEESGDEIFLYLGEGYEGFNGQCKLTDPKFTGDVAVPESNDTTVPESSDTTVPEVSVEEVELNGLIVENGICHIPRGVFDGFLASYGKSDYDEIVSVKIQLTYKIETKWAANIINDVQLNYGQIGIASIKYENKSDGSEIRVDQTNANPVIDCETKFVKASTELKFYTWDSDSNESMTAKSIPMMEIPVTITPYYNGKENTDADIIPKFVDEPTTEDINEAVIQNYEIPKNDLPVDWKLRTATFTLQCDANEFYDVFYKVGFCPADGKEATEKEVIESLKLYAFMVYTHDTAFTMRYPEWAKHQFGWSQFPITGKSMWFPVSTYENNGDDTFAGIMYIELFNSGNGSKFNDGLLKDKKWQVYVNRDERVNEFYAPLKDYMLDKGNIPSVWNDELPR